MFKKMLQPTVTDRGPAAYLPLRWVCTTYSETGAPHYGSTAEEAYDKWAASSHRGKQHRNLFGFKHAIIRSNDHA